VAGEVAKNDLLTECANVYPPKHEQGPEQTRDLTDSSAPAHPSAAVVLGAAAVGAAVGVAVVASMMPSRPRDTRSPRTTRVPSRPRTTPDPFGELAQERSVSTPPWYHGAIVFFFWFLCMRGESAFGVQTGLLRMN